MPKHQVLGLKEGYTGVAINERSLSDYNNYITEEIRQQIHEDALRKEIESLTPGPSPKGEGSYN